MPVFLLDKNNYNFPDGELAHESGLLALGGDLSAKRLLNAYSKGIFPWYNEGEIIKWWCPKERFLIFPSDIKISKSMKKVIKRNEFEITFNNDFKNVIHSCRKMREFKEGTWITDYMEEAYNNLFKLGYCISTEVYKDGVLCGGLYGVSIGKCFFGESMFSKTDNASKAALIFLADELRKKNYVFIDCQFYTEHLESMGGVYVSWNEYKKMLKYCME